MKQIGIIISILLFSASVYAGFPMTKVVNVSKLEVWPSNEGIGRYAAYISPGLPEAGCQDNNLFYIKNGPGMEAAYSTLLAATMAGKKIEIYITGCSYAPVVDRVRVIIN